MEAILHKNDNQEYNKTCISSEPTNEKYKLVVKHLPLSWGYNDSNNNYVESTTEQPINEFIDHIVKLAEDGIQQLKNPKPMIPLTLEQEAIFETSTNCQICTKELLPYNNRTVEYNANAVHYQCRIKVATNYTSARLDPTLFEIYKQTKICYLCNLPLTLYNLERVRDHCHITGNYR